MPGFRKRRISPEMYQNNGFAKKTTLAVIHTHYFCRERLEQGFAFTCSRTEKMQRRFQSEGTQLLPVWPE